MLAANEEMSGLLESKVIPNLTVYGVRQVAYVAAGSGDPVDYGTALAMASLTRAEALELQTASLSKSVRVRSDKCESLGKCLAEIERKLATFGKSSKMDDPVSLDKELTAELARYGIDTQGVKTKGDLQELEAKVRYEMDRESSQIKLDMTTVRNMFNTRDRSFQQASAILKKVSSGFENTMKHMR